VRHTEQATKLNYTLIHLFQNLVVIYCSENGGNMAQNISHSDAKSDNYLSHDRAGVVGDGGRQGMPVLKSDTRNFFPSKN